VSARRVVPPAPPPPLPPWLQAIAATLPPLLTIDETAATLRVSRSTIKAWIKTGTLIVFHTGPGRGRRGALGPATAVLDWLLARARPIDQRS
jgi:excisionase family DNA binding protein